MEALVEEAVARTEGKFTADEISSFINAASAYVQKPIFMLLCEMLTSLPDGRGTRMQREIDAISASLRSMSMRLDGNALPADVHTMVGAGAALDIWLAIGPHDYTNKLKVPDNDEFVGAIYANYGMLRKTAIAYWERFKLEYKTIYEGLVDLFGADVISTLKIPDDRQLTLCWDPAFARRVVIMSAYRNARGFIQLREK